MRVRYGAGDPYTPVVNRVYDMGSRSFVPVYGERDSERLSSVVLVDVRIDKEFPFRRWTLPTDLDLQNALNAPGAWVDSLRKSRGAPPGEAEAVTPTAPAPRGSPLRPRSGPAACGRAP